MFEKIGNDSFKTVYLIIVCAAFLITAYFFATFFIFSGGKTETEQPGDNQIHTDIPDSEDPETTKQVASLRNEIDVYDKILASSYMRLVNKSNPLPDGYEQTALIDCESNPAVKLESITAIKIQEFINAAKEAGYTCKVVTGYRTYSEQESIYNKELQSLMNAGYPKETAEAMASMTVSKPGESEFETGYAVELTDVSSVSDMDIENTEFYTFVKENIYKYGFILRYPQGKDSVTGYSYNPLCFRFIGDDTTISQGVLSVPHAQYIYEKNLTLEEYLDYIRNKRAAAVQSLNVLTAE